MNSPTERRFRPVPRQELQAVYPGLIDCATTAESVVRKHMRKYLPHPTRRANPRSVDLPVIVLSKSSFVDFIDRKQNEATPMFYAPTLHTVTVFEESLKALLPGKKSIVTARLAEQMLVASLTFVDGDNQRLGFYKFPNPQPLNQPLQDPDKPSSFFELTGNRTSPEETILAEGIQDVPGKSFALTRNMITLAVHYMLPELLSIDLRSYAGIGLIMQGHDELDIHIFDRRLVSLDDIIPPLVDGSERAIKNTHMKRLFGYLKQDLVTIASMNNITTARALRQGVNILNLINASDNAAFLYPTVSV